MLNIFKKRSKAFRQKNVRERAWCLYFVECDSFEMRLIKEAVLLLHFLSASWQRVTLWTQLKLFFKTLKTTERLKPGQFFFLIFKAEIIFPARRAHICPLTSSFMVHRCFNVPNYYKPETF